MHASGRRAALSQPDSNLAVGMDACATLQPTPTSLEGHAASLDAYGRDGGDIGATARAWLDALTTSLYKPTSEVSNPTQWPSFLISFAAAASLLMLLSAIAERVHRWRRRHPVDTSAPHGPDRRGLVGSVSYPHGNPLPSYARHAANSARQPRALLSGHDARGCVARLWRRPPPAALPPALADCSLDAIASLGALGAHLGHNLGLLAATRHSRELSADGILDDEDTGSVAGSDHCLLSEAEREHMELSIQAESRGALHHADGRR